MHLENHTCFRANRLLVVRERGFVGGADFTKFGATGFENVGNAKTSADLNQFAAGS